MLTLLPMPDPATPHWEHGYRAHGLWRGGQRLAHIGLSPPGFRPLRYVWSLDPHERVEGSSDSLRAAKRAVARALAAHPPDEVVLAHRFCK